MVVQRIYYPTIPRSKVHSHVTNKNGAYFTLLVLDLIINFSRIVHDLRVAYSLLNDLGLYTLNLNTCYS